MRTQMQYVVNENGVKTSVIVPYDEWNKIITGYQQLQSKMEVFAAIQEGLEEIDSAKKQGKKLQTLADFLNESNS